MSRITSAVVVLSVVLAACGGGESSVTTTTPPAVPQTTASQTTSTQTTSIVPATTSTPTTNTSLPGEPFDIGPRAGDTLGVIGVAHDDVLNVRAAPGVDQPIVAELAPLADDVVALGDARALPESIWLEIEVGGVTGWANSSFLGYLGQTTDVTADIVDRLGELPRADTLADLGMVVSGTLVADGPPSGVVMSVGPTVGDLGEVTFDVIGIRDDAVRGLRVHVFATQDGEGFVLKSVEQTLLCGRGLSGDICV